jgi:hypothetical protein
VIAGRLAKKGVEPTRLSINSSDTDGACEALTALLTEEQHHRLFARVRTLSLNCMLSKAILQVRAAHLCKHKLPAHSSKLTPLTLIAYPSRCWRLHF